MSAHSLCLRSAPVFAPRSWMGFNQISLCVRGPTALFLPPTVGTNHLCVLQLSCTQFINRQSGAKQNSDKCSDNPKNSSNNPERYIRMGYSIRSMNFGDIIQHKLRNFLTTFTHHSVSSSLPVTVCSSLLSALPILRSACLLCPSHSRFTRLFGGCNAMPSVGSCCWRPLVPN